jgi:glyceraldehyde 3-phosphate dehydrogenase
MIRIAINGFGRIGRTTARIILNRDDLELVAVNDLTDAPTLAHLLKYDTIYGKYDKDVQAAGDGITVEGKSFKVLSEKEPVKLPWADLNIDVVIESTGRFTDRASANGHVEAGAKAVVISAPSKGDDPAPTFLMGVNHEQLGAETVINNASCTTNCIAPTMQVLEEAFGIERSLMTTIHAYTADQNLQDGPHKDLRRARAAAGNIVPTTTGAAIAVTEVIPTLKDHFDGVAIRVPVQCGSISDITAILKREATVEEINQAFIDAASSDRYKGILQATTEPLVSSDIVGNPNSAIIDLSLTQVIGNLVKVFAWYDNEFGYSMRLVEMVGQINNNQN